MEHECTIQFDGHTHTIWTIAQWIEALIQGVYYSVTNTTARLAFDQPTHWTYCVSPSSNAPYNPLVPRSMEGITIQPTMIIDWVRLFRQSQPLYRQTGATACAGVVLSDQSVFALECVTPQSVLAKLWGALIRKQVDYYPVLLVSFGIQTDVLPHILRGAPSIIIGQSSVTNTAIARLIELQCTVFGFCRKQTFNRYSNFHL